MHKGDLGVTADWNKEEFRNFLHVYNNCIGSNGGGIWIGLGTWMLHQAASGAQLILLDLLSHGIALTYRDKYNSTIYLNGKYSLNLGFMHIMFDDSADIAYDQYNIQIACQLPFDHNDSSKVAFKDNFGHANRPLTRMI